MKLLLLLLTLCQVALCSAQKFSSLKTAVENIHDEFVAADNSHKAISVQKIAELDSLYKLSYKENFQFGIEICGTDLIRQHIRHADFQKVINIGTQIIGHSKKYINSTTATETYRMIGLAYSSLGFQEKSIEAYHASIDAISIVKSEDFQHYLRAIAYENITTYFEDTGKHLDSMEYYYRKSIEEATLIPDSGTRIPSNYKFNAILYPHMDLANYYQKISKPAQTSKAEQEIKIALKMMEGKEDKIMISNKIELYAALCKILLEQKRYAQIIPYAETGLQLEQKAPSPYSRLTIFEALAKAYLAEKNTDASAKYMNLYTALGDSLQKIERSQTSKTMGQLLATKKAEYSSKTKTVIIWATCSILLIALLLSILMIQKSRRLKRRYDRMLETLKNDQVAKQLNSRPAMRTMVKKDDQVASTSNVNQNVGVSPAISTQNKEATQTPKEAPKQPSEDQVIHTTASDQTLSRLLPRLEAFEQSETYLSQEISLSSLSQYLETNQTYTSELLKLYRGTTYRNYINQLKIDYIKRKLYEDPLYREYKMLHLAQVCGFASRQVFISVFKKQTGMPPSYYINKLKEEELPKKRSNP